MEMKEFMTYFEEAQFIEELQGKTRDEVLQELIETLTARQMINNPQMLLETLKKRETLGSTGFGKHVAIPHCRTLTVSELVIVAGHSTPGIEWEAMDKKPVHWIFLIIAPPQEKQNFYLPVLGKICELIRDNKIRKNLLKLTKYEEFIQLIGDAS